MCNFPEICFFLWKSTKIELLTYCHRNTVKRFYTWGSNFDAENLMALPRGRSIFQARYVTIKFFYSASFWNSVHRLQKLILGLTMSYVLGSQVHFNFKKIEFSRLWVLIQFLDLITLLIVVWLGTIHSKSWIKVKLSITMLQ